jgi:hypothetical protein
MELPAVAFDQQLERGVVARLRADNDLGVAQFRRHRSQSRVKSFNNLE